MAFKPIGRPTDEGELDLEKLAKNLSLGGFRQGSIDFLKQEISRLDSVFEHLPSLIYLKSDLTEKLIHKTLSSHRVRAAEFSQKDEMGRDFIGAVQWARQTGDSERVEALYQEGLEHYGADENKLHELHRAARRFKPLIPHYTAFFESGWIKDTFGEILAPILFGSSAYKEAFPHEFGVTEDEERIAELAMLADQAEVRDNPRKAREYYLEAIELSRKIKDRYRAIILARKAGLPDLEKQLAEEAIAELESEERYIDAAFLLKKRGGVKEAIEDIKKAEDFAVALGLAYREGLEAEIPELLQASLRQYRMLDLTQPQHSEQIYDFYKRILAIVHIASERGFQDVVKDLYERNVDIFDEKLQAGKRKGVFSYSYGDYQRALKTFEKYENLLGITAACHKLGLDDKALAAITLYELSGECKKDKGF